MDMRILFISLALLFASNLFSQEKQPATPDQLYGELFHDVQTSRIFPDGKTFVDCIPKKDPELIVKEYLEIRKNPAVKFSLEQFVKENFQFPGSPTDNYKTNPNEDIATHIRGLWKVLRRDADLPVKGSSLLPLPHSYIVPGGRFREIYY